MRVLQVEDDTTTAKSVELMLMAAGHACETADCGADALRLVEEQDFDLILLDIMLPDIDGYEVLKRMKAAKVSAPVLIQSGLVQDESERAAFGVVDSLVKPYGSKQLQERIEAITQRQVAEKAAPADGGEDGGEDEDAERRRAPRARTIKGAQIIYNNGHCDLDCLILSLSDSGAALQPQDMLNVPDSFVLRFHTGQVHRCQVCWRHADKVGVRFVDA